MNSLNLCILGMMSTTASLGLILLWDVDAGLTQIDKYLYSTEDYIKVVYINPFAPEPPVTARADPGPFYPL